MSHHVTHDTHHDTPQSLPHIDTRAYDKKQARKAAIATIKGYQADASLPAELVTALITLYPGRGRAGEKKARIAAVREDFAKLALGGAIAETSLFEKYRLGRPEMRKLVKSFAKASPQDRLWVRFDKLTGNWVLSGKGEKAPDGWK